VAEKLNGQMVEGTLQDTAGRTRAITLYYVERVQGDKLTWWNDIRRTAAIGASGDYVNAFSVNEGATKTTSFYPFGCVTGASQGRAVGIPPLLGPRISRIGYNADADLLYVAFDVALTGANIANSDGQGHGSAEVAVVRYDVDPIWGFRDTARQYYALFPEVYTRRAKAEGIWLPFADPTTITGASDFGFAFHEGNYTVQKDDSLGIASFRYSVPMYYEMPMDATLDRTYDAALIQLQQDANGTNKTKRQWARAVLNSGTINATDLFNVSIRSTVWNDGATWIVNPNPNIPAGRIRIPQAACSTRRRKETVSTTRRPVASSMASFSMGSRPTETFWTSTRRAWPTPLHRRPSPPIPSSPSSRMVQCLRDGRLHEPGPAQRGKLLMANGTAWRIHQFVPLVDVPGAEVEWMNNGVWRPDNDPQFNYRRTLAYQKPFLLLQNTDFTLFGSVQVEKYFQRSLFYGCFPSLFHGSGYSGYYWQTSSLYNRDRSLFVKYIPLIKQVSQAGWEPVTYASSSNPGVYLERYGKQYLTLFNLSASAITATITINLGSWGVAGSSVQIMDDISGRTWGSSPPSATRV